MRTEKQPYHTATERRVERKDKKIMDIMEQRHTLALLGVSLEREIVEETSVKKDRTKVDPEDKAMMERVTEQLKAIERPGKREEEKAYSIAQDFKRAIGKYILKRNKAKVYEEALHGKFGNVADELGEQFFRAKFGNDPVEKITVERREGFFIITAPNAEDYAKLYGAGEGQDRKCADLSGGSQHQSFDFPEIEGLPTTEKHHKVVDSVGRIVSSGVREVQDPMSVLLVKTHPSDYSYERIVTHERQHFINNDVLGKFIPLESSGNKRFLSKDRIMLDVKLVSIKDEVIARIREGGTQYWCTDFLQSELYANLVEGLDEKEKELVTELMVQIREKMNTLFSLLDSSEERALLVYHLLDVSLESFPKRLAAIEKYYAAKLQKLIRKVPERPRYNEKKFSHVSRETLYLIDSVSHWLEEAAALLARLELVVTCEEDLDELLHLEEIFSAGLNLYKKALAGTTESKSQDESRKAERELSQANTTLGSAFEMYKNLLPKNKKSERPFESYKMGKEFIERKSRFQKAHELYWSEFDAYAAEHVGLYLTGKQCEELLDMVQIISGSEERVQEIAAGEIFADDKPIRGWIIHLYNDKKEIWDVQAYYEKKIS